MFIFRRFQMPHGDSRDMLDRIKGRFDEIFDPKRHSPPVAIKTLLDAGDSESLVADRKAAQRAWHKESFASFTKICGEEADAQWDRIVDRRASDWFYSGFIGVVIGFALGKIF